jgi:hypothetical protein
MKYPVATGLLVASLALVGACGRETSPNTTSDPAAMPPAPTATDPNAGAVNPEAPGAGMNSTRPDGTQDIAPGSDTGAATGPATLPGTGPHGSGTGTAAPGTGVP